MITVFDIYRLHQLYKYRIIYQNGDSFEGKEGWVVSNDGTVSYDYDQGVYKYLNGVMHEGNKINNLWNGKVSDKWENGDREISEMLNDNSFGPVIIYDFDGKVKMSCY